MILGIDEELVDGPIGTKPGAVNGETDGVVVGNELDTDDGFSD